MSVDDLDELSEEDLKQKREELKEDTRQARQVEEEKKQSLLDSISSDSDIGNIQTVDIGDMEIRHKSYIPGEQLQKIKSIKQGTTESSQDSIELLCSITKSLHDQQANETHSDDEMIREFWRLFIDEYGTDAYGVIMDRLLAPLMESTQEKMDALNSFPAE
jgi:ATP adenylyltransferase/5',5'''-P-1,P-4-tetraphosphate phosphorylase II